MNPTLYVKVHVPTRHAIDCAIAQTGSQRALAEHFGLTQQAVAKWAVNGVPKKYWKPLLDLCKHDPRTA